MAFVGGHEFIVENKLGIIFNFYLNEQKHIECIVSNENHEWMDKNTIFSSITEDLHVDIDADDRIHIISYSKSGKFYHHQYDNKQWVNNLIAEYSSGEQKIIYPIIKCVHNQIHIFYCLLESKQKNQASLFHLKFQNAKHSTNHVTTIYFNKYINPFKVFFDNDKLILLYTSIADKFEQIFISKSDIGDGKWTNPICLSNSEYNKIYVDSLLFDNEILHFIWSNYDNEHLLVQYSKLNLNEIEKNKLKPISLSTKSSCSFPTLIYYKKILWAIWTEMGKIVSSYSSDIGANWSIPYVHNDSKTIDFKRYRYLTNYASKKDNILCDFVFGSLYPCIQFLGFGGEIDNDEIPTN